MTAGDEERPAGASRVPAPRPQERYVGNRDLTRWPTAAGRWLVSGARGLVHWSTPRWALLLTLAVGLATATAMGALAGEVYEAVVESDGVAALDRPVLDTAVDARTPTSEEVVTAFTDVGGPVGMPVLATSVTVALAVLRRSWTPVVLMVVATAGSLLMTVGGKAAIGRSRPPLDLAVPPYESSASFPSGHSLNAMVVAGVVTYLLVTHQHRKRTRALTLTLAVLFVLSMGLSRVYLGHHWLTDVLVAWTLGLAWLAVVITGHRVVLTLGASPPPDGGRPQQESGGARH